MLLTTADFKKGLAILVDKAPFLILECNTQTPTARGSATLVRTKIRNILTGQVFDRTFKSGEKFETGSAFNPQIWVVGHRSGTLPDSLMSGNRWTSALIAI